MYNIHLLPATFGDSILVEYGNETEPHYILIDGGPYYTFAGILDAIKKIVPKLTTLELLVVTHIDIDHIDGIVSLLNQTPLPFQVQQVWFNGYKELSELQHITGKQDDLLGALQGEYLSTLISSRQIPHNRAFDGKAVCITNYNQLPEITLPGGMILTLLSPGADDLLNLLPVWKKEIALIGDAKNIKARWEKDKRYKNLEDLLGATDDVAALQALEAKADNSEANRSSIAFLASFDNKTCLLAGDAPSDRLLLAANQLLQRSGKETLELDAWKLAHHGSKKSTHADLMQKISCRKVLVSSDGKRYKHPDKECIAHLLENRPSLQLYFNYRSVFNEYWDKDELKTHYGYTTFYPAGNDTGITVAV